MPESSPPPDNVRTLRVDAAVMVEDAQIQTAAGAAGAFFLPSQLILSLAHLQKPQIGIAQDAFKCTLLDKGLQCDALFLIQRSVHRIAERLHILHLLQRSLPFLHFLFHPFLYAAVGIQGKGHSDAPPLSVRHMPVLSVPASFPVQHGHDPGRRCASSRIAC